MSIYHTGNQMSNHSPDEQHFFCTVCLNPLTIDEECPNCIAEQEELELIKFTEFLNEQKKTMKRIIIDKVEREVEITLPYFSKDGCYNFKVISEKETITVMNREGNSEISLNDYRSIAFGKDAVESNATEFREAYAKALDKINEKLKTKKHGTNK